MYCNNIITCMTHSCINVSKAYPKITDIVPQKGQNDSKIVIFVLAIVYDVISYSVWSVSTHCYIIYVNDCYTRLLTTNTT